MTGRSLDAPTQSLLAAAAAAAAAWALVSCSAFRELNRAAGEPEPGVSFYSDLGAGGLDVSGYPPEQRRNYEVYAKVCSECHGLARSINSPVASRAFWDMYVEAMRRRSYYAAGPPLGQDQARAVVDFLDYDSQTRKIARRAEFDAQTAELKSRWQRLLQERGGGGR